MNIVSKYDLGQILYKVEPIYEQIGIGCEICKKEGRIINRYGDYEVCPSCPEIEWRLQDVQIHQFEVKSIYFALSTNPKYRIRITYYAKEDYAMEDYDDGYGRLPDKEIFHEDDCELVATKEEAEIVANDIRTNKYTMKGW